MNNFREYLNQLLEENKIISSKDENQNKKIVDIEKYITGPIPPSYMTFLNTIGHGIGNGWEFLGTGKANQASLIGKDSQLKKSIFNIPNHLFLISDIGDDIQWYIDTSKYDQVGECKIRGWVAGLKNDEQPDWIESEVYENFETFFMSKMEI